MPRRQHLSLTLIAVMAFLGLVYLMSGDKSAVDDSVQIPHTAWSHSDHGSHIGDGSKTLPGVPDTILKGGSIAPKLENETLSLALKTYIHLFARLYPCGQCADHFQKMLVKYPPQTSSRNAAAGWACFVHNEVNKRTHKEQFDCTKIGDFMTVGVARRGRRSRG
ncbi:hypothetical protein N0V88_006018 [Collariella sp. IMI 366227]|nr:hypothetical protein N0V88_006018 [Collariella sp. IMI 366227]